MAIIHTELFDEAVVAGTEEEIDPVAADGKVVKDLPSPEYLGSYGFSPTPLYHVVDNPTSFEDNSPMVTVHNELQSGLERHFNDLMQAESGIRLVPNSQFTVSADAGGNEDVNVLLYVKYGVGRSISRRDAMRLRPADRKISKGAALTADVWTSVASISDLKTDRKYAILGAFAYSANARAVRFKHTDFMGLTPALPGASAVASGGAVLFPLCPVFSGASPLQVEGYTSAAEDMDVFVLLREL